MRYILFISCLILFANCKGKNDGDFISTDNYEGYLKYPVNNLCESIPDNELITRDLTFHFNLKYDFDFEENDYEFMIILRGSIYRGKYSNKIEVNNLCFRKDGLYSMSFIMFDKTNKIIYKWHEKQSYFVQYKNNIKITLYDNGTYWAWLSK